MFPYENLEVYKKALSANQKVYKLLKENSSIPRYAKDQFGRASLSIMLNIAEEVLNSAIETEGIFSLQQGALHLNVHH